MGTWLIRLSAQLPGDLDPEVRADLLERTRTSITAWPGARAWRVVGGETVVAVVESGDPHELVSGLPRHPWLNVTVEPLVDLR